MFMVGGTAPKPQSTQTRNAHSDKPNANGCIFVPRAVDTLGSRPKQRNSQP